MEKIIDLPYDFSTKKKISKAIKFIKQFIGNKYKWWCGEDLTTVEEPFYSINGEIPNIENIKCISCTGVINLMRRYLHLDIPGYKENEMFPGSTHAWYNYLKNNLCPFDINKIDYLPKGTLLIRKHKNLKDQGHVAVILKYNLNKKFILHSNVLKICNDPVSPGLVRENLEYSNNWRENGFYEYYCLPEFWLN
jgi:hypothetical protein